MSVLTILAALAVLSPRDGAVVSAQEPAHLRWRGPVEAVYLLNVRTEGVREQAFAVSNRTDVWLANLELGASFEWTVREAGTLESLTARFVTDETAPRALRAEGVRGFCDLGGWRTSAGRRVRQNRIFRADTLCGGAAERWITRKGIATLVGDFGIRTEIDLRPARETLARRASILGEGVCWKNIPLESADRIDSIVGGREPFLRIFGSLTADSLPLILTGPEGKDGLDALAFLLNGLLGVSEGDLRRAWRASSEKCERLVGALSALPGSTLHSRIEAYVRGCGISETEIEAFRSLMLE